MLAGDIYYRRNHLTRRLIRALIRLFIDNRSLRLAMRLAICTQRRFSYVRQAASRLHLLHLSIDFSGSVGAASSGRRKVRAHTGGPAPSLYLRPRLLHLGGSRHPWRTGIKFNCLAVAFGRVRNREQLLPPGLLLVPHA